MGEMVGADPRWQGGERERERRMKTERKRNRGREKQGRKGRKEQRKREIERWVQWWPAVIVLVVVADGDSGGAGTVGQRRDGKRER